MLSLPLWSSCSIKKKEGNKLLNKYIVQWYVLLSNNKTRQENRKWWKLLPLLGQGALSFFSLIDMPARSPNSSQVLTNRRACVILCVEMRPEFFLSHGRSNSCPWPDYDDLWFQVPSKYLERVVGFLLPLQMQTVSRNPAGLLMCILPLAASNLWWALVNLVFILIVISICSFLEVGF